MKKIMKKTMAVLMIVLMLVLCTSCQPTSNNNTTVYITATGSVYHKTSGAHGYSTHSISLENAKTQGYTACKNGCY